LLLVTQDPSGEVTYLQQNQLVHYLANAGSTRLVSREEDLTPGMFEFCLPMAFHGRHLLPLLGYHLIVAVTHSKQGRLDGSQAALIHESRIVGVFTTCLVAAAAEQQWAQFEVYYFGATDRGALACADWPLPKMPKVAPWVASFPFHCTHLESKFVPDFVGAWAWAFVTVAAKEMTHPVE
jgi:hypothetical protein